MKYYSTNRKASDATLEEAVVKGLAADRGLYMPHNIRILPASFYAYSGGYPFSISGDIRSVPS